MLDPDLVRIIRDRVLNSSPTHRFGDVPNWDGETFEADVEWELECLKSVGIRRVVMVDLTKPEFALPVVRIVVPGLEPDIDPGYVPGRRGQRVLAAKA
jgi:ribosomal protein S12 methylthiotransferase accessory factor